MRPPLPLLCLSSLLAALVACKDASSDAVKGDPEGRQKATSASAASSFPSPPPSDASLVVSMTPAPHLEVGGAPLRLGMKSIALTSALGTPTWSTDYGANEGAMSNTTYLSYAERGVIVRTKAGVVEGFYVYLTRVELEKHVLGPAHPALPGGLGADATLDDVRRAVGEPTKREVLEAMDWIDLVYDRAGARVKFHFEKNAFASVSIETMTI